MEQLSCSGFKKGLKLSELSRQACELGVRLRQGFVVSLIECMLNRFTRLGQVRFCLGDLDVSLRRNSDSSDAVGEGDGFRIRSSSRIKAVDHVAEVELRMARCVLAVNTW